MSLSVSQSLQNMCRNRPYLNIFFQPHSWDLLIASFGALFFELLLIRWLPTSIYHLGYFKNCILFATFLGFGIGCATKYKAERMLTVFGLFIAMLLIAVSIMENRIGIVPWQTGELLWPRFKSFGVSISLHVLLMVTFIVATFIMIPLGRQVGMYFRYFNPITAYSINIGASLLGIGAFLVVGYLQLSPLVWFSIAFVPFIYATRKNKTGLLCNVIGLAICIFTLAYFSSPLQFWSPYYKITLEEEAFQPTNVRLLSTNNNGHQIMYDLSPERLAMREEGVRAWTFVDDSLHQYDSAYAIIKPESVLIIGGGTGNEAAAALRHNVRKVHVAEIDPVIIKIGRKYHPEKPYQDPRVTIINDDARHYMATTKERYDLIIYGFLDSQSYLSAMSNIRLDNYVYTVESFKKTRQLLSPNGLLQVTYFAMDNFIRARIFLMIKETFQQEPLVYALKSQVRLRYAGITFFAGPAVEKCSDIRIAEMVRIPWTYLPSIPLATDDWPYLNLRDRKIGKDYLIGLGMMTIFSFVIIYTFVLRDEAIRRNRPTSWMFFLQGSVFMLLETNTISRMALLVGSTWVVTSLAILLVLMAALVANYIVHRFDTPSIDVILAFLILTLLLNYMIHFNYWLQLEGWNRILFAALCLYLPILGSSLLFARLFQCSDRSNLHFGVNILGAVFGGMLEYSSLIIGINSIYLLALSIILGITLIYMRSDFFVPRRA